MATNNTGMRWDGRFGVGARTDATEQLGDVTPRSRHGRRRGDVCA